MHTYTYYLLPLPRALRQERRKIARTNLAYPSHAFLSNSTQKTSRKSRNGVDND